MALAILDKFGDCLKSYSPHQARFLVHLKYSFINFKNDAKIIELSKKIEDIIENSQINSDLGIVDQFSDILKNYCDLIQWENLPYDNEWKLMCDVIFLVGEEGFPIPAHRCKLAEDTNYFQGTLVNPLLEEDSNEPIPLSNVTEQTFLNYLFFVYKNELPEGVDERLDLSSFAKHIGSDKLYQAIYAKLEEQVNTLNDQKALSVIKEKTLPAPIRELFLGRLVKNFEQLDLEKVNLSLLFELAEHDKLFITEIELFQILVKWEEKHLNEGQQKGEILHQKLSNGRRLMDTIRFEHFSRESYKNHIIPSPHFNSSEKVEFMKKILNNDAKDTSKVRPTRTLQIQKNSDDCFVVSTRFELNEDDVSSSDFEMFGALWKIYIKQKNPDSGKNYHLPFLKLCSGSPPYTMDFKLEMGGPKTKKLCKEAKSTWIKDSDTWGWTIGKTPNSIPISNYMTDNVLHLKWTCKLISKG